MSSNKANLTSVPTPWSEGLLLICQKCGTAIDTVSEPTKIAENLRDELRAIVRASQQGPKVRVIVSGCLSVCEKNLQAIAYTPNQGQTVVMTYDPAEGKQSVVDFLKDKLSK